MFNLDTPDAFRVRKSLGLIWVTQHAPPMDDDQETEEHGPFMDLADAYEQCGRPEQWIVEFNG